MRKVAKGRTAHSGSHRTRAGRAGLLIEALEPRLLLTATITPTSRGVAGPLPPRSTVIDTLAPPTVANTNSALLAAIPTGSSGQITAAGLEIQPASPAGKYKPNFVMLDSSPRLTLNGGLAPFDTASPTGMTPAQMRHAYGIDQVMFGAVHGDGTGQTIAIVDAYDYPTATSDLHNFDLAFGIPDPPSLTRVNEDGGSALPGTDPSGPGDSWEVEEALDVEWAHAIAPGASILLVEATTPSDSDLFNHAVNYARSAPGVVAVTMSFGRSEDSSVLALDQYLLTPAGHTGVTFFASTGDYGEPSGYPALSPNVVAVGGTTLNVDSSGNYLSETGWDGSGGGLSSYETQPSYQNGVVTQSTTQRANPDVAFDADPATGASIYDSYDFGTSAPWITVGGTSLSSPCWAGIAAIADQGRTLAGAGPMDGLLKTLPRLYAINASSFHDITSGNNGYAAGPGYDLVTGRGSPIANILIGQLSAAGPYVVTTNPSGVQTSAPATIDFNFSGVMDPTSFSLAADVDSFTGPNGAIPLSTISGFSWLNGNTTLRLTFTPQTTDGTYSLAIGPQILSTGGAAMDQNQNGVAGEATADQFTATWGYDTSPLQAVSTSPAGGTLVTLPFTTLDVHFNEAFDASTIDTGDLTLSQGTVTAATVVNSTTARYTLSNITTEGLLTVTMPYGAVRKSGDDFPMLAYSTSFTTDIGTRAMPPAAGLAPVGSLIFQTTAVGTVGAPTDTDNFTLFLDAGQSLTVTITGDAGLQPTLLAMDPSATILGSAASAAAGTGTVLEMLPVTVAGTYTITVGSVGGTTGAYTLVATLNAARQSAAFGGPANQTQGTAQNIDASFVNLFHGRRGAVLGALATYGSTDWYSMTLAAGDSLSLALASLTGQPTGAGLQLYGPTGALLATGSAADNADAVISDFVAPAAGVYAVRIAGSSAAYSLLATANVSFDTESNNTIATAQQTQATLIGGTRSILGHIDSGVLATTTFDELPYQSVDGLTFKGVTYGFTIGGVASSTAYFDSYGPGTTLYVSDPSLIGDATGTLTLNLTSASSVLNFGMALESSSSITGAATVTLYDSSGVLIGTRSLNAAPQGYTYAEALFNYVGTPVKRAVITFNSADVAFAIDNLQVAVGNGQDLYAITAAAGANLQLTTTTPFDGAGDPINLLDPRLRLLDAAGNQLAANDNSAADGRNAVLNYTVASAGTYYVEVSASPLTSSATVGDYVLTIAGATTTLPSFTVASTTPANGATVGRTTQMTVAFSDGILLSTLDASDLTIDGTPATAFTVVNGSTVIFTLPAVIGDGAHAVAMAAGALSDLQGTPLQGYSGQFILDATPPKVVSASIHSGDVLPTGNLTLTVQFSEKVDTSLITSADIFLAGGTGSYTPATFSFDASQTILTAQFTGLPEDLFTLRLVSSKPGVTAIQDLVGNALDGNSDGTGGDDYRVTFSTDAPTGPFPTPLTPLLPKGSLVYDPTVSGVIGISADTDDFTLALDAGQTLTVTAQSGGTLAPVITILGPGGATLGSGSAAAGGVAVAQTLTVTTAGTYTLRVSGTGGTTGAYTVRVVLNAALENESNGGATNNTLATAQNIDGTMLNLGAGASRGAVVGVSDGTAATAPDGYGYAAAAVTPTFEDISTTGTPVLVDTDDSYIQLLPSDLGSFTFRFYGTTYNTLFVSSNGLITFGSGNSSLSNTDLTTSPTQASIAALWNDLIIYGQADSAVYWQVKGVGASQHLVVQWQHVEYYSAASNITFEAVLNADGSIQFNYANLDNTTSSVTPASRHKSWNLQASGKTTEAPLSTAGGGTATVGIKDAGTQGSYRLLPAYDNGPNAYVGTNQSTRIGVGLVSVSTPDYYSFTMAANTKTTIAVTSQASSALTVQLYNASGTLLASGAASATNLTQVINNYAASAAGTYYVAVSGNSAPYSLVVTKNAAFDQESNSTPATAQPLAGQHIALGYVVGGSPAITTETEPNDDGVIGASLADLALANDLRGSFISLGSNQYSATVTGTISAGSDADWDFYRIHATAGDSISIAENGITLGDTYLRLYDSTATLIAYDDDGGGNLNSLINYSFTTTGDYYIVADSYSTYTGSYTLAATLTTTTPPAGQLDTDMYTFTANAGDVLQLSTSTPTSGSGEFVNLLDPALDLYDPSGTLVGSDDNSAADGRNALLNYTAASSGTYTVRIRTTGTVTQVIGIQAQLYVPGGTVTDFPNFNALTPRYTQTDPQINFAAAIGNFDGHSDLVNDFAVRWTGVVNLPTTGTYTFYTNSDDGSRLYVDNVLLVSNGGQHGMTKVTSSALTLSSGAHAIRVEYFQRGGNAGCIVGFTPPGGSEQIIPAADFGYTAITSNNAGGEYALQENRLPTASNDSANTPTNTPITVTPLANDFDPDGDILAITALGTPAHGGVLLNANNSVTYTPANGYIGADSFTYTISDGAGGTRSATVFVTVTAPNRPPVANAGPDLNILEGALTTVNGGGSSDPDNDPLTYSWNFGDNSTGFGVAPSHQWATGVYTVTLTVSDGRGGISSDQATVNVSNVAPTVAIQGVPTSSIPEGTAVTVSAGINDPGTAVGDTFTYAWTVTKDGVAFASSTNASFTFTANDNATWAVSLQVTDRNGGTAADAKSFTATNVAPTLSVTGTGVATEGTPYTLNLASSDPGTDTITSWSINWGDGVIQTVPGNPPSVTHTYADGPATWLLSGSATDEDGTYAFGPASGASSIAMTWDTVAPASNVSISQPTFDALPDRDWRLPTDSARDIGQVFTVGASGLLLDKITIESASATAGAANATYTLQILSNIVFGAGTGDTPGATLSAYNVLSTQTGTVPAGLPLTSAYITFALNDVFLRPGQYAYLLSFTSAPGATTPLIKTRNNDADPYTGGEAIERMFGTAQAYPTRATAPVYEGQAVSGSYTHADMVFFLQATPGLTVQVLNATPTVSAGGTGAGTVGQSFTRSGSFTDLGLNDNPWTATVDYGDGSGAHTLTLNADKSFNLSKIYASAGTYLVTVRVTDKDNGVGTASFSVAISPLAPSAPVLTAASDTGTLSNDRITKLNNATPAAALTFSVAGTIAGATVTLYANGNAIGTAVATGTTTLVSTNGLATSTLADGPNSFTARLTVAGLQSASSAPVSVTVDTAPPTVSANPASTGNPSPSLDGAVSDLTASVSVTVNSLKFNAVNGGNGFWILPAGIITPGLTPGTYTISVTATDSAGNAATTTASLTILPTAILQGVAIDDGTAQRSMVRSLTLTFDQAVTFNPGALELTRSDGLLVPLSITPSAGNTSFLITFSGPSIIGTSLADGNYALLITSAQIRDQYGRPITGGNQTVNFFRLYGDLNGDGDTDADDYLAFRTIYTEAGVQTTYVSYLDFDGNGVIDDADFTQFRARLGRHV